jgi:hypothetical protein
MTLKSKCNDVFTTTKRVVSVWFSFLVVGWLVISRQVQKVEYRRYEFIWTIPIDRMTTD